MKVIRTARAVAAAALWAAAPLAMAAEPVLEAGNRELELDASLLNTSTEGIDATVVTVALRHGWFLSPEDELGVIGSFVRVDGDLIGTTTYGTAGLFYDRNFVGGDDGIVPVLGVSAQGAFGDAGGSVLEASGGVRVFGSEDVSVNLRAFYQRASDDGLETRTVGLRVGLSWIIR